MARSIKLALFAAIFMWPTAAGLLLVSLSGPKDSVTVAISYFGIFLVSTIIIFGALNSIKDGASVDRIPAPFRIAVYCVAAALAYTTFFSAPAPDSGMLWFVMMAPILLGGFAAHIWLKTEGEGTIVGVYAAIVASLILFLPFIYVAIPEHIEATGGNWISSIVPFFNIRRFTSYLATGIASATGLFLYYYARNTALAIIALVPANVVLWTALFWSGGRAPVLALILSYSITGLLVSGWLRARIFMIALPSAVFGLLLSQLLPRPNSSYGFLDRVAGKDGQYDSLGNFSSLRIDLWSDSFHYFLARPFFGNGYLQLSFQELSVDGAHFHSHFFMLDALHNFGIIGGLPLILLVFGGYMRIIHNSRSGLGDVESIPFMALSVVLAQSFFDGTLHQPATVFAACFSYSALHCLHSRQKAGLTVRSRHLVDRVEDESVRL